jgi:peptidoglycan/LPS O-acetylase OafA/YrhL
MRRVHFPGLNELRFIAWLAVFLGHVEQGKELFHYPHRYWIHGRLGVVLFFVISGFLISYLLLSEKWAFGGVSVKDFYVRRILRIWPLYFLLILLCMLVVNRVGPLAAPAYQAHIDKHFWTIFWGYALFVPTLVDPVLYTIHVWSIAVEEQFYIAWPWVVKWSRGPWLLVLVPVAAILAPTIIWHWPWIPIDWRNSTALGDAGEYARHFSCLGIGCLAAICYLKAPRVLLRFLYHPLVQAGVLSCLVVLLWIGHRGGEEAIHAAEFGADSRWYSLLFSIVILNVATNPRPLLRLENRIADYLGRISYGLYMYHPIAIALTVYALRPMISDNYRGWLSNALVYLLSFGLSVLVASASYYLFEEPFLRLKSRFARVPSG